MQPGAATDRTCSVWAAPWLGAVDAKVVGDLQAGGAAEHHALQQARQALAARWGLVVAVGETVI